MTDRTGVMLTVAIALLVCASAVRPQDRQPLQYHYESRANRTVSPSWSVTPEMTTDRPQGVRLPQFRSKTQFFTRWSTPMVPSGGPDIAVDKTNEHGRWNRLFVDSDADGHLDDEEAVTTYQTEQYDTHFGPVRVILEGKDGPIDYHLNFRFFDYNELNRRLYIYSGCWYEGQIMVDWIERHCLLVDGNVNGTFDDKWLDGGRGDSIKIGGKRTPSVYVGNFIEVGGSLYHPEIARQGGWLRLTKAENVKFGSVQFPETITSFMTGGENGLFRLRPDKGIVSLPVGKYRILHWSIDRKDDKGRRWDLSGFKPPDSASFEVNHVEQTRLSIGEPVLSVLEIHKTDAGYSFIQRLKGRLGEHIQLDAWGPTTYRPGPPKLRIRNKDGSYDRTFTFEYG